MGHRRKAVAFTLEFAAGVLVAALVALKNQRPEVPSVTWHRIAGGGAAPDPRYVDYGRHSPAEFTGESWRPNRSIPSSLLSNQFAGRNLQIDALVVMYLSNNTDTQQSMLLPNYGGVDRVFNSAPRDSVTLTDKERGLLQKSLGEVRKFSVKEEYKRVGLMGQQVNIPPGKTFMLIARPVGTMKFPVVSHWRCNGYWRDSLEVIVDIHKIQFDQVLRDSKPFGILGFR